MILEVPDKIVVQYDMKGIDKPPYKMATGANISVVDGDGVAIKAPIKRITIQIEAGKIIDAYVEQYRYNLNQDGQRAEGTIESRYALVDLKMDIKGLLYAVGPMENSEININAKGEKNVTETSN